MAELTIPVNTNQNVIAYWIASPVPDDLAEAIAELQAALKERFSDAIWAVPRESLHISFNALSPIFEENEMSQAPSIPSLTYLDTFSELVSGLRPIELHFDTVEAFPAAIILKAHDNGTYKSLRDRFNEAVTLPSGTKATPNIIHTTICKFHSAVDLDDVNDFLTQKSIRSNVSISEFRVVREKVLYMVDYDILQRFTLSP